MTSRAALFAAAGLGAYGWRCGAPGPKNETGRRKKCNRAPAHPGPHRIYPRRTFRVLLEWPRVEGLEAEGRGVIGDDDLEGPKRPTLERIADSLESIAGEVYRIRVALEVVAGDALDRAALEAIEAAADLNDLVTGAGAARGAHPAGGELRYLGRLGPDGVVGSIPDDLDLDDLEGES